MAGGGDDIAFHRHGGGEAAMDAVIAQQMGVGLHRPQIVDMHDLDIAAAALDDGAQNQAADAPETVDGNPQSHVSSSPKVSWRPQRPLLA